jgi:hypothetical protein
MRGLPASLATIASAELLTSSWRLGDDRFNSGAGSDTYIVVATVTMPAISHPAAQTACIKSLTERHRC